MSFDFYGSDFQTIVDLDPREEGTLSPLLPLFVFPKHHTGDITQPFPLVCTRMKNSLARLMCNSMDPACREGVTCYVTKVLVILRGWGFSDRLLLSLPWNVQVILYEKARCLLGKQESFDFWKHSE